MCCLRFVVYCMLLFMRCVVDCVLSFVVPCALFVVRWSLYVVHSSNCVMCVASCCSLLAVGVWVVVGRC